MKRLAISGLCLMSFLASPRAFAIIDLQASIGTVSGTFTPDSPKASEKSFRGQSKQVAAHFHILPIPLMTLGVGLGLSTINTSDTLNIAYLGSDSTVSSTASISNISGLSVGPDVIFGVSIPTTNLMPFARLNYAINVWKADATVTVNSASQTFDGALQGTGTHLGIGVAWSPIPLLAITGEYQMNNDTLSVPDVKTSGGISIPEAKNSAKSTNLLFGAQFNL